MQQTFLPKYCSERAIMIYVSALVVVSVMYISRAMLWYWWIFGIVEVAGFFYFANSLTKRWAHLSERTFKRQLFFVAFFVRLIVMLFLYWFFNEMTGQPFMFAAADSYAYHETAQDFVSYIRNGNIALIFDSQYGGGVSDLGYPFYLSLVYLVTDESILFARILKCLWGSLTCIFIYKIARRNFGESVARMAAIFCMLMPNLIYYCGVHLKETEMTCLLMAFAERADYVIHQERYDIKSFAAALLLGVSLFTFRTVLGAAAMFSFVVALVFTNKRVASLGRRWLMLIAIALASLYFVGGRIAREINQYWGARGTNQSTRLEDRSRKGNTLAKYAGVAVFAPMIFTLPFPTMVETENQETARLLHGGNVVKNIMSGFVLFSIVLLIFGSTTNIDILHGEWRNHLLIEVLLVSYLGILAVSAFAHAERFHMPAIPLEMIFAAYGVSNMTTARYRRYYMLWCGIMFVAFIGWNWFKMKGRGYA